MKGERVDGSKLGKWQSWENMGRLGERKEHGQIWCGTVDLGRKEDELERKDGEWFSLGLFV